MSKKRIVEILEQGGVTYGQINDPADFIAAQNYARQHVEFVTKDYLSGTLAELVGGGLSLTVGLGLTISSGRIYKDGKQYDCAGGAFAVGAANATNPRIDLIVATIADDAPADTEYLGFQRIRTEQEFIANHAPYPPTQFQRSRERWNTATISVKAGVAASNPIAPALGANEVLLYTIKVPANAVSLISSNVTDGRKALSNISLVRDDLTALTARMKAAEDKLLVLKYRYPTALTGNGKLPFNVAYNVSTSKWVVDIPFGIDVQFGDGFVRILAENFQSTFGGTAVNAQYVNISGGSVTYLPLVEPTGAPTQNATTGNEIRFNVPTGVNALYLNRDGQLFFRAAADIVPSNPTECLLLKIDFDGTSEPPVYSYRNIRNSITNYSGTQASGVIASKQFRLDLGVPSGVLYPYAYAERASDKVRYSIPTPSINFDSITTVSGVNDGDTWHVDIHILSAL